MGKSFNDVMKMDEMVEDGIKSGNIISFFSLKATTQTIQRPRNFRVKKKEYDVVWSCRTLNTLFTNLNIGSTIHNHISNRQSILNGEHQHITIIILILKMFNHFITFM